MTRARQATVRVPVANVHQQPVARGELETQAKLGETLEVVAVRPGWSRVRRATGDVGWLSSSSLAPGPWPPTRTRLAMVRSLFCNLHAASARIGRRFDGDDTQLHRSGFPRFARSGMMMSRCAVTRSPHGDTASHHKPWR